MTMKQPSELGICYLATPYSKYKGGDIQLAFIEAAKLAAKLFQSGLKVYSPIAHTHPLAIYGKIDPLDHKIWMPFDEAMMAAANTLIVAHMEGWEESYGIKLEIEFFEKAGKPIYDLDPASLAPTRRQSANDVAVERALARITELDAQLATIEQWGAAVSVMHEERQALMRTIAATTLARSSA